MSNIKTMCEADRSTDLGVRKNRGKAAKKGWKTGRLDEVCYFTNGLWKGEKPPFITVGVIRNTNFTKDGSLDYTDIAFIDVEERKFEKRRLQFGDIILEKSGGGPKQPVGRVALFDKEDGDFSFSNFTAAIRVKDGDDLDSRFLHKYLYWLYQSGVTEGMQSNSTGIRNLDGDAYKSIEVYFPNLSEQRRIVGVLDEAFAGLATAQANAAQNLQNARALFDSHLQSVFTQRGKGWVEKRLGDVFEIGSSKRIMEAEWTSAGVPFYGGKEIVKLAKVGSAVSNAFISEEKYQEYASKYDMPRKGDILITARGTIGLGYIVQDGDKFYYKDGNIISLRAKMPCNPYFVLYAFRSRVMADQFAALAGTTVRHLPIEKAKELVLSVPKYSVQNSVVANIGDIEGRTQRLAAIYQQKLTALAALKQSLLHQAFTGQL